MILMTPQHTFLAASNEELAEGVIVQANTKTLGYTYQWTTN